MIQMVETNFLSYSSGRKWYYLCLLYTSNTKIEVPGSIAFCDLGATVSSQSSNNLILTKVQGRDYSRKELVSGGDINFTVTGKIVSNYPDIYPYELSLIHICYAVTIDKTQNVLKNDTLIIKFSIVPVGEANEIDVVEGLALTNK